MWDKVKKRIEFYVLAVVVLGGVTASVGGFKGDVRELQSQVSSFKEQQAAASAADEELLDAKLAPLQESGRDIRHQMERLQADVNGLSVASSRGTEEQARLIEGKMVGLQQQLSDVQDTQRTFIGRVDTIQARLDSVYGRVKAPVDTVVVTKTDTLAEHHSALRRILPW